MLFCLQHFKWCSIIDLLIINVAECLRSDQCGWTTVDYTVTRAGHFHGQGKKIVVLLELQKLISWLHVYVIDIITKPFAKKTTL